MACLFVKHLAILSCSRFAVCNMNAETAEHLKGCIRHAVRMFCRRASGSTIFWTCTGRERGLWEEDTDANTRVKFLNREVEGNIKRKTAHKQVCYSVTKGRYKILAPSSNRAPCNCSLPLLTKCIGRYLKAVTIASSLIFQNLLNNLKLMISGRSSGDFHYKDQRNYYTL
jgi:hypothetical protein